MHKKFSILLPVYNGEEYIEEQILSILNEIHENDELIIINDGSSDSSLSICKNFKNDNRVRLYNKKNQGLRKAINFLLIKAKNDFIVFADHDDVWLPGRLEKIKKYLDIHDCVVVNSHICDEKLNPIDKTYFEIFPPTHSFMKMFYKSRVLGCCMAFKRESLDGLRLIPYGCWHDHFIMLWLMIRKKNIFYYDKALVLYRRHKNTLSMAAKDNFFIKKIPFAILNRAILIISILKSYILINFREKS